jgi:tRNA pseudouridine synthase 10
VLEKPSKEAKKKVYELNYKKTSPTSFSINLTADGGLPIKRFVEGNNVNPNLSDILGVKCKCEEFDFHDIEL